eukprot:SAG25_NODE_307_length_10059_cov_4.956124_4_plen_74_part_00
MDLPCFVPQVLLSAKLPVLRQVLKVRNMLREAGLEKVDVGGVDDYQGQEQKIIFLSTVVSSNTRKFDGWSAIL